MTGGDDSSDVQPAWHDRTSTVLGGSIAALAMLAVLFQLGSCVSREFSDPGPAPQYFVDPDFSGNATPDSSAPTTTQTITSTIPPVTTDINPGEVAPPPPGLTTSGTDTTSSESSPTRRTPRTREPTEDDDEPTTTRRPRFNETRTLNP